MNVAAKMRAVVCAIDEIRETRECGLLTAENWLLIVEAHSNESIPETELAAILIQGGLICPET